MNKLTTALLVATGILLVATGITPTIHAPAPIAHVHATTPSIHAPTSTEYVSLDQVPTWYKTMPYERDGVCMVTATDITCESNAGRKHTTLNDKYTRTLYKLI